MKLYVHDQVMMIHIKLKFHEVSIVGYIVMAHLIDFKSIQGQ